MSAQIFDISTSPSLAGNGQICDAAHWAFKRGSKGIAYFMLVAGLLFCPLLKFRE